MKKIVITIAIAAIVGLTGATQAATIYEKDGLKYSIKGDWQIQYRQEPGVDRNLDVEFDDLEIKNAIAYDLNSNLTAIGQLDFGFKKAADKGGAPHLEEAYLGFQYKAVEFVFGKTGSAADDFGIIGSIETTFVDEAFELAGAEKGDDLTKLSGQAGPVYFIVTHELEAEGEDSENGSFTDVLVTAEFSGLSLGAAFQTYDPDANVDDDDVTIWGVSAGYDFKVVSLAVDYSMASDDDDNDASVMNVCLSAPVQAFTIGLGYQAIKFDDEDVAAHFKYGDDEFTSYYANVVYAFPAQKNVSIFAEIAGTDYDDGEDDWDMGYLMGARIKF